MSRPREPFAGWLSMEPDRANLELRPAEPEPRRLGCSVFILLLIALASSLVPAPSEAQNRAASLAGSGLRGAPTNQRPGDRWESGVALVESARLVGEQTCQADPDRPTPRESSGMMRGPTAREPLPRPVWCLPESGLSQAGAPPSNGLVGPKYSASATWCAPTPRYCTGWGGDARLAAVYSFRFGDRPYWVRLTRGDAFADALVVSHCACHGQTGYIDVSPAVFRRLAPLSRGRIAVEVELLNWPYEPGGDPPPHPDDEEMRVEDNAPQVTTPPTDTQPPSKGA